MNRRIATLAVDPANERATQAQTTTRWLLALSVAFAALWLTMHSEYFMYFTALALFATLLSTLAGIALTASANAKLTTDLERRGLSDVKFISKDALVAQHSDQKVRVTLVAESRTRISVWISPDHN